MQVDNNEFLTHPSPNLTREDNVQSCKPWLKSGVASKISPEVKRRRRNYRFRKLLAPKNPLMILNELKSGLTFEISESVEDNNQIIFTAKVQYEEGKVFSGRGMSKKLAQQAAAEETLKGLFFDKLLQQLPKNEADDVVDIKIEDGSTSPDVKETTVPEDDTPWSSLASLAFYKLINEWQNPVPTVSSTTTTHESMKSTPGGLRKLPENPTSLDPVMLLHQISPSSKFVETARDVRDGEHLFTLSVEFNGQYFEGTANRKKDAKKICARKALATINVHYD